MQAQFWSRISLRIAVNNALDEDNRYVFSYHLNDLISVLLFGAVPGITRKSMAQSNDDSWNPFKFLDPRGLPYSVLFNFLHLTLQLIT